MKKKYIKPQAEIFELCSEAIMLKASVDIKNESATQWSNKKSGWDSDNWSNDLEEE